MTMKRSKLKREVLEAVRTKGRDVALLRVRIMNTIIKKSGFLSSSFPLELISTDLHLN